MFGEGEDSLQIGRAGGVLPRIPLRVLRQMGEDMNAAHYVIEKMYWDPVPGGYAATHVRLEMHPRDPEGLGRKLAWYSQGLRLHTEGGEEEGWTPEYRSGGELEEIYAELREAYKRWWDPVAGTPPRG